jgi:hypothetical protein
MSSAAATAIKPRADENTRVFAPLAAVADVVEPEAVLLLELPVLEVVPEVLEFDVGARFSVAAAARDL